MIRDQLITLNDMGTVLVSREHSFSGSGDGWYVAKSHALYCPKCKRIWAELMFEDDRLVWPVAQTCENCELVDDWMPVPGSLLVEEGWGVIDYSLLDALPEYLLKREVELHLKAYST